jgi:hypothetical protein
MGEAKRRRELGPGPRDADVPGSYLWRTQTVPMVRRVLGVLRTLFSLAWVESKRTSG